MNTTTFQPDAPASRGPSPVYGGRALVVFSGATELRWLRLLRAGYRHCFVVVELDPAWQPGWLLYNPLSVGTQVSLWPAVDAEVLRDWLDGPGHEVVETRVNPRRAALFAWRPYTCVEAVKRVLGLNAPRVWTPWQLRQRLIIQKIGKKSLTGGSC